MTLLEIRDNHCLPQNNPRFNFMQSNYCHEANENAVFSLQNHIVLLLMVNTTMIITFIQPMTVGQEVVKGITPCETVTWFVKLVKELHLLTFTSP